MAIKNTKNVSVDEMNNVVKDKLINMTFDQRESFRLGNVQITLAFILSEICDYLMREAESNLKRSGQCSGIRFDVKRDWRFMMDYLKKAKIMAKDFTKIVYRLNEADSACQDSDDILDLIRIYVNRAGNDREIGDRIRNAVRDMYPDRRIMDRREEE